MGKPLENDFSWSKSRREKFEECPRAYWFHYYASWGGWDRDAAELPRKLYGLKKLSNRWTWAGSITHDSIKRVLLDIRGGRRIDERDVIDRAHLQMREDFRHSRSKAYWQERLRREFSGLVEHEYGEPVPAEEWKQNWENVKAALEWFLQSRWISLAQNLKPKQWLEVDEMDFDKSMFILDGVKVWAIPDFAYLSEDGAPVVVDWKTGLPREGYDDQVLAYALYLSNRYGHPVDRVRCALVYLNARQEQLVEVDAPAVETFHRRFAESVAKMRAALADVVKNVPKDKAAFPESQNPEACARCVFRGPCGKVEAVRLSRVA